MALTLAIDMGTTNLKVGVVNERGKILSSASTAIETNTKEEGGAEHDPEELKSLLIDLCGRVLVDCNKADIQFIISSTYHFGLMLLDENRNPLTGITLLTDTRSQITFSDFVSFVADDDIYDKTGCPLISQYLLPRLFYFSKQKRGIFEKTRYFHDSKSFLFEWLTGEWITDISTATATQLYNIHRFCWDEEILSTIGLSADQLPPAYDGTKLLAPLRKEISELLRLSGDVQVVLGAYDGAVLGFGLSGLQQEVGVLNIGTTAMLRVPGKKPILDKNENKRIQAYALNKNTFLNGGALNNAALPLDWMRTNLFEFDLQNEDLLHISKEPPLISLPYLTGERDPKTGPFASGVFFGLRRNHSRIDFVRSVLEGVAYSMRFICEALKENDLTIKEIRMGGGGVNIKVWPQIFADILGYPVTIPDMKEIALVGNSMLAFTAGGIFKDIGVASKSMLGAGKTVHPNNRATTTRNKHYEFYKKLRENTGPLFKEHAGLRC